MTRYLTVNVKEPTKERFNKAHDVIEERAIGSVSQSEAVDELVRFYLEKNETEVGIND